MMWVTIIGFFSYNFRQSLDLKTFLMATMVMTIVMILCEVHVAVMFISMNRLMPVFWLPWVDVIFIVCDVFSCCIYFLFHCTVLFCWIKTYSCIVTICC